MQHHCPHCGRESTDDFELLDERVQHTFRCDVCKKIYFLYFAECQSCLSDSIFSWQTQMADAGLGELRCRCCAQPLSEIESPINST
jgi:hypothetical protein